MALWRQGGKIKESLQLRLWNLNSTSNSPVAPRRMSCQISANQQKVETKKRAKGNDVIINVISANQHFSSTFSMQIFKFQKRSCNLPFLFPPRATAHRRAGSQAITIRQGKAVFDTSFNTKKKKTHTHTTKSCFNF